MYLHSKNASILAKCACMLLPLAKRRTQHELARTISALYITGDKAKETYATIQPFLDFKRFDSERESLEYSIEKRRLKDRINLTEISAKYELYKEIKSRIEQFERERENVATRLRELTNESNASAAATVGELKSRGKQLREQQRAVRDSFYPIEDEFVHAFLNLPNSLHPNCAIEGKEKLIFRNGMTSEQISKSHLERQDLLRFINNDRYYLFKDAAKFDVFATQALTRYMVEKGAFLQTANPDFVRLVLLEANATPLEQYHKVIEQQLQNQLNCAYLTGGGSFESYLAAVTRLCIYPSVIPLKYVCCGRIYEKSAPIANGVDNLFTATQSNAVQTFVATETAQDADEQFEKILNLAVDFFKALGIHFRIVYEDAGRLTAAESLRASIQVFSPNEQRYVCVGRLSNYNDYVSKRILFCKRKKKEYRFLYLIGGPILFTTRLIGALIENKLPLKYDHLLGMYKPSVKPTAIEEFKELFK